MTTQAWKTAGQYFQYKGHSIFYRSQGNRDKPILLLVHGFPTASWDWHKVWDQLSVHFQLYALDMIGFGFSDKPKAFHYTIHAQADLHDFFLKEKGITQYHILAHDYGDTVVQEMLARQLEDQNRPSIKSICFLNGGLFPALHQPRLMQTLLNSPIGFLIAPLINRKLFARSFSKVFGPNSQPSEEEMDAFYSLVNFNNGSAITHKLIGYMNDRKQHQVRWEAATLSPQIPVRLIDGAQDPVSGRHLAAYYLSKVPNPDVVILEQVGHYPQTEAAAETLKHFLEFMDTNRSKP